MSEYRKTTEGSRGTLTGNIKGLLQGFYSPSSVKDIKEILRNKKPDVVVIHNLYPYISPAILKPIKEAGIPIIMTIHNYRLICPTGLFMRDSKPCELCLEKKNELSCIQYNCEHSLIKSIGYAGRNWFARITKAYNNVDVYACITEFQAKKLVSYGFPNNKMRVIPNFVDKVEPLSSTNLYSNDYVAISGRMSKEKGTDMILDIARKTPHIKYLFAGVVREDDQDIIKDAPDNCIFAGYLSDDKLVDFYNNSRFIVIGSRCYEGFSMSVLDASMYGKATIGPAHGGFIEIIDDKETGLLFTPNNSESLQQQIEYLWNNTDEAISMGVNAYNKLKKNYTSEAVKDKWERCILDLLKSAKQ
ncbi:glycosyltransferase involved in cell wall biosynthesis [Dysgonomonadaceae bacterium PH5-43]|nr:glycosyltransferase involved in cell wall biosynthesis [Dysgonomonadaceae bacterium PH5-43]